MKTLSEVRFAVFKHSLTQFCQIKIQRSRICSNVKCSLGKILSSSAHKRHLLLKKSLVKCTTFLPLRNINLFYKYFRWPLRQNFPNKLLYKILITHYLPTINLNVTFFFGSRRQTTERNDFDCKYEILPQHNHLHHNHLHPHKPHQDHHHCEETDHEKAACKAPSHHNHNYHHHNHHHHQCITIVRILNTKKRPAR